MPIDAPTQDGRPFRLTTPLGKDVLLCMRWEAEEHVSRFYRLLIEAWSLETDIAPDKIVGQHVELAIRLPDGSDRLFGGIVKRFVRGGSVSTGYTAYVLEVAPPHFLCSLGQRFRMFQEKTTPELLAAAFEGTEFRQDFQTGYKPRPYCVQYRESDWTFATRLMEQEGMWYRFDHTAGKVTMIQSDGMAAAKPAWGLDAMEFVAASAAVDERVHELRLDWRPHVGMSARQTAVHMIPKLPNAEEKAVAAGRKPWKAPASLWHYDFEQQLEAHHTGIAHGGSETRGRLDHHADDIKRYARVRQEAAESTGRTLVGKGACRGLASGARVSVQQSPDAMADGAWFVPLVRHEGHNGGYLGGETEDASYHNAFEATPIAVTWRPPRTTPWPQVASTHTGVVVGPSGEEIHTDKYGRIQVVMHWEEEAPALARSCWMRVAQTWAGPQFGAVFIPRIGHEVIVAFLDGNPDNPVVVGSLYNEANLPPWELPTNKTQSGVRSRSTLNGTAQTYNELRFEDKKGEELVNVQAEKNLHTLVKNDETREVKHDRTTTITNDETRTVLEGNDTHVVKKGKQSITVEDNDRELTVAKKQTISVGDDQSISVGAKQDVTVANDETYAVGGKQTVTVDMDRKVEIKMNDALKAGMGITIEANTSIELKCGPSSVKIDPSGITLKGPLLTLEAQGVVQVKGAVLNMESQGPFVLKGALGQVQASAVLIVKGLPTMIN